MTTENFGGVFLLHETAPKRLLGSLRSTTCETGPGWIHGSFFSQQGSMSFADVGNKTELVLSRDVAFALIGLIPVLVATSKFLRKPNERWSCGVVESGRITVSHQLSEGGSSIIASWVPDPESIICQMVGNQIEWRIREDLAMELFLSIVNRLAQTAANLD